LGLYYDDVEPLGSTATVLICVTTVTILINGKMESWVRMGHVRGGCVMAVGTVKEYVQRINGFSCDSVLNLNRKFNP
jgi:hypothetical protein